jgi:acetyl esterase/lipase
MKLLCIHLLLFIGFAFAQEVPKPDSLNASYGPYERNIYDFWKAPSPTPTPLVVYIHGGGFSSGSKEKVSATMVNGLLKNGISIIAINYRLTPTTTFPGHYLDCARAIQFARFHAKELNIDPSKIAATGGSAGGCASLWLAFHPDLADSLQVDPVLRMSTKLCCVATFSGQTTLEPEVIRQIVGELALQHSMFNGKFLGLPAEEAKSPAASALYRQASPVNWLTSSAPPVWMYYSVDRKTPTTINEAIHNYNFGAYLKEKMDKLGVPCILLDKENGGNNTKSCIEFFKNHFGMN